MKPVVLAVAFGVLLLAALPARSAGHGGEMSAHFGHFNHGFDHRRFGGRFDHPSCFDYAYCSYYAPGCVWTEGYWTNQPSIGPDGIESFQRVWIPAGCY